MLNKVDNYSNHLELFIHQDIINNFLSSIRSIDGGGKIGGFDYNWDISILYCDRQEKTFMVIFV